MTICERKKELKRRRHRREKIAKYKKRLAKATASEKAHLATKIRRMTIGGDTIVANLGLEAR